MWRIRFRPQARTEIREARSWYEGQLSGLGRAFIAEASWIVFLLLVTLPGYGVAVVALARPLRRLAPSWLATAAGLTTIATPTVAAESWRLAGNIFLSNPGLSNWLFGTAPWLAGVLAVPVCYLLVASVECSTRRERPNER